VIAVDGEQILDEPGFLVDDGQRIVDLVGHTGGQAADGGQLVGILHLVQGLDAPPVGGMDAIDKVGGHAQDGNDDQHDAKEQEADQTHARLQPQLPDARLRANHQQGERGVGDGRNPQEDRPAGSGPRWSGLVYQ
jgi:hypothetical protein